MCVISTNTIKTIAFQAKMCVKINDKAHNKIKENTFDVIIIFVPANIHIYYSRIVTYLVFVFAQNGSNDIALFPPANFLFLKAPILTGCPDYS